MSAQPIDVMREQHHKMIDWMLANFRGKGSLQQMADAFGYSYAYLSTIINSDMFKAELARRREMVNTVFAGKVVEQTFENASRSAKLLNDYLAGIDASDEDFDPRLVLDINDRTMKQLGYAPNKPVHVNINDNSLHVTQQVAVEAGVAAAARERMMNRARQGVTIDGEASPSNG